MKAWFLIMALVVITGANGLLLTPNTHIQPGNGTTFYNITQNSTCDSLTVGANYATINFSLYGAVMNSTTHNNITGYAQSVSIPGTNTTQQIYLSATYFRVVVYNEQNNSQQLEFNITVYNNTASYSINNQTLFYTQNTSGFPTGEVTVVISKTGWSTRTYYGTYNTTYSSNLVAYLLQSGQGIWASFYVITTGWEPIANASLNFYRPYGANWVQVAQGQTDSFGVTQQYLDPYTTYEWRCMATDYAMRIGYISPIATEYYIILGESTSMNFSNGTGFFWAYIRPNSGLVNKSTDNITFRINDPDGHIIWFALNISNGTGSYWFSNVSGSPTGGTIIVNLSSIAGLVTYNDSFYVIASYSRNMSSLHQFWAELFPILKSEDYPSGSIFRGLGYFRDDLAENAPGAIAIISILFLTIMAGIIGKTFGFGAGIAIVMVGAIMAYLQWIPWQIFIFAAGFALLLFMTYGRRFGS